MLANFPIGINIPVADLVRAQKFYADKLGLDAFAVLPTRVVYHAGDSSFALVPSEDAGKDSYSLLTWYVNDLVLMMKLLRAQGVTFEVYDWPGLKMVDGVADLDGNQLAWFKDSEGNLLALAQLAAA
jgi:catechol 2,3-dioxygenase-like lactoylglutathione lyase family enzyme